MPKEETKFKSIQNKQKTPYVFNNAIFYTTDIRVLFSEEDNSEETNNVCCPSDNKNRAIGSPVCQSEIKGHIEGLDHGSLSQSGSVGVF